LNRANLFKKKGAPIMDVKSYKKTAIEAAHRSAKILRSQFGNTSRIRKKAHAEIVTEADTESENAIISTIQAQYPDHSILGEECGLIKGASEYKWIIDPLDGTVNFAHQIPIFSISIALAVQDTIVLGVILDPVNDELFAAVSGQGAKLNGDPIQVSASATISESLLVTGFPYDVEEIFEAVMVRYSRCLKASQAIRRLGTAALDLCYVACGRFEGFWEQNLKPWDTAAGALLVVEAGGRVTTFADHPYTVEQPEILATNGIIHKDMLGLLQI
jgi:myo-inositol-1(or 4)-monophosphatase